MLYPMLYLIHQKREEIKKMKQITYMNCITGEVTENHNEAMEWYRIGVQVDLIEWCDVLNCWVKRGSWVWYA